MQKLWQVSHFEFQISLSGLAMILEDLEHRYEELHKRIELVRSYL